MVGIPMPPTPDEPGRAQRQDERQAWEKSRMLELGEGTPEAEHIAAMRAAVDIARLLQGGMMGDEAEGIKVGMFGPDFDVAISRHIGLDGVVGRVFMAADEMEHADPEDLDDFDDPYDASVRVHFDPNVMVFGLRLPSGEERYQVVALDDTLRAAMRTGKKEG